uniref:Sperm associated antigen 16 n=2 Tax=Latimeria chalumnae TaxID=7897 RepID=H3B6C1_LATCH
DNAFYLEQISLSEGSEEDFQYEDVSAADDFSLTEGDEDLDSAIKNLQEQTEDAQLVAKQEEQTCKFPVSRRQEVVDDFLRNFLVKMGMTRTLDCFQTEWYELIQKGLLNHEDVAFVPDVYVHNQLLGNEIKSLRKELDSYKQAADKAHGTLVKLQKERDFHRMHHKRVVQEKNRLINDIKRLKKHYESYEPLLKQLNEKYQAALRQKLLTSLERDRAVGQVTGLQATLRNVEYGLDCQIPVTSDPRPCKEGPTQKAIREAREKNQLTGGVACYDVAKDPTKQPAKGHPKDSEFPLDTRVNPYLAQSKGLASQTLRSAGFRLNGMMKLHELAISCVTLHPRKRILVTASDDHLWKMCSVPNGDVIMTGKGHTDWLSGCCFHPSGNRLATTSGDTTLKIWDFSKSECLLSFEEHTHVIWSCSWHTCGDFVASCSMDKTSKIWDINSERCRCTLRGHTDSVNSIEFLPFSNILLTSSADKTLSLWDARMGLCAQTFYGHLYSCNDARFNLKGDTIASCDSYGVLKLWDVRKVAAMLSVDLGPHPGNQVAFSPSGQVVAVASNDGTVKIVELGSCQQSSLVGHEDAVQSVQFDLKGDILVSGGSDGVVCLWS